jgi:hypothetical protein
MLEFILRITPFESKIICKLTLNGGKLKEDGNLDECPILEVVAFSTTLKHDVQWKNIMVFFFFFN